MNALRRSSRALSAIATTCVVTVVLGALLAVPAVGLASVAQGFDASENMIAGTLVSLDPAKPNTVQPANVDRVENLLGVVVAPSEALLNISTGGTKVQVATSGTEVMIVSNAEGDIKPGDRITASFINGVGVRTERSTKVVGAAQAEFTEKSVGASKRTVVQDGKTRDISIGHIPVSINVTYYASGSDSAQSIVPDFVQRISDAIGGKKVSTTRILIGAAILIAALLSVTVLLYSAVRSSIISIGRNPLSQSAVRKSLMQVLLAAVSIIGVSLAAIYLLFSA